MNLLVRILIALIAAFFLVNALGFWFAHDLLTTQFAIHTDNILGRASIRADFGGFFFAVGFMSVMAAWRMSRTYAYGAMLLLGFALAGRFVSLALDGPAPGGTLPMVVEAVCIAVLAWGRSLWRPA